MGAARGSGVLRCLEAELRLVAAGEEAMLGLFVLESTTSSGLSIEGCARGVLGGARSVRGRAVIGWLVAEGASRSARSSTVDWSGGDTGSTLELAGTLAIGSGISERCLWERVLGSLGANEGSCVDSNGSGGAEGAVVGVRGSVSIVLRESEASCSAEAATELFDSNRSIKCALAVRSTRGAGLTKLAWAERVSCRAGDSASSISVGWCSVATCCR